MHQTDNQRYLKAVDELTRLKHGIRSILVDYSNHKGPPLKWKSETILRLDALLNGGNHDKAQ